MGKSGKKIKSDKINALRKQYDEFLEEDKKRKDRNEYILGRMETMGSCTALVNVRSKAHPKPEVSNYSTQPKHKSTMAHINHSAVILSDQTQVTPRYTNINYDEATLLKEVSKKYFLIPKVMSNVLYNVNYKENERDPIPTDESDWKSKYNILDELKRQEKMGQSDIIIEKPNNNSNVVEDNKNKHSEYISQISKEDSIEPNSNPNIKVKLSKPQTDTVSNKELSNNDVEVKPYQKEEQVDEVLNDKNIWVVSELNIEKQELDPELNELHEVNLPAHSALLKETQMENKYHEIKISNALNEEKVTLKVESTKVNENNKYLPEINKYECHEFENKTAQNVQNNLNNYPSPIVTTSESIDNNTFSVNNIENKQEFVHNENTVSALGVFEEVASNLQDLQAMDKTEQKVYQHQESDLNQNVQQNVTMEVNDELETEQKEMFFTDHSDKIKGYNENNDPKTYPTENENYIKQEYSYYDESQKEQIYPIEINEHEESTERYDQNYEQQYVNNYDDTTNEAQYQPEQYNVENCYDQKQDDVNYQPESPNYEYGQMENVKTSELNQDVYYTNAQQENSQYENSEIVGQQDINYTTSEDYDAQQEYITMHVDSQGIENIEHQLDVEDCYIPNSNEDQNYREQVIEEMTPEIQENDIKVT